ncbi:hypothetical protein, partial [Bilophila wadsworthia]|uniref:hypothetical protein n=1 Tax=Bilophila wadsworthia TaxID=35833 RepID=UPI003AB617AC
SREMRPSPLVSYLVETSARMPLSGKVFSSMGVAATGIAEKKTNAHREAPFLPSQNASVEAFCRCLRVYPEQMGFEMI